MKMRDRISGGVLAILLALAGVPASAGNVSVYVTGSSNEFGTLDLSTGAFSNIATLALPAGDYIYGMGFGADGRLYGVDSEPNANLWQINPSTGAVTEIGSIGQSATDATSDAAGKLFVLSQDLNAVYYTMNPPSTSPSVVGPIGMSSGGLMAATGDGSQLYTTTQSTYHLVSINPTTGATSTIGNGLGYGVDNGLFVGSTLYAFDIFSDAIVTINTTSGTATQVGTYSLPGGDIIFSSALVPEPSGLVLGLIGLATAGALSLARRRRRGG
jgi:hypothetical protein